MKLRSALLLVVAATVCALSGLFSPQEAAASIDVVNNWPATPTIVSSGTASPLTGKFIPGAGSNRMMLVVIATRYSTGTPTFTVTYGGQSVVNTGTILPATNTAQLNKIWVGYLAETGIAAGAAGNKTLSITDTNAANRTSLYASVSVYNGVDQTAPFSGAISNATSGAGSLALTLPLAGNVGKVGNTGLAVYFTNWQNQTQITPSSGYTELKEYTSTNVNLSNNIRVTTGIVSEAITTATSGTPVGVAAGVSLNPVTNANFGANYQTVTTCGDCHSNPPQDGTARNTPPGLFPGSHDKHSGQQDGQYAYACSQCHYPYSPTAYNHSSGYKNITGSSITTSSPYNGGKRIPISNLSTLNTCSNISCHNSGRASGMGTVQYGNTPAWGTPVTDCLACHGGRNALGNPAPSSPGLFRLSTTHSQHLKYPAANMNCQICHAKTAANATALKSYTGLTRHLNGKRDVVFTDIAYGSYTSYKSTESGSTGTSKLCTNVACHGGSTRSAWKANAINSDNTCVHCHGIAGTVSGADRRAFAPGFRRTGTSTDQIAISNNFRVGSHFKHLSSAYMKNIKCNECHQVPSNPFDGTHMTGQRFNSQTLTFLQASTANITIGVGSSGTLTRLASFTGYTNGTSGKAATCSSVYCHGNRMKNGETGGTYRKPYWNYSAMINYSDPATACKRCHGLPPTSASHPGATINTCTSCHGSVVNGLGVIINKDLHINGRVEGGGTGHVWSYGGTRHKVDATGNWPFSACTGCHSNLTGVGNTYPPAARSNAALVSCVSCHINTTNFQNTVQGPGCWDCHGSGPAAAAAVPNGNAFPNISGSHSAHTALGYLCADCHVGGGTGTAVHGNYSSKPAKGKANVVVKLNPATAGAAASQTWTGVVTQTWNCTTSVCHGQKSPDWGQAVPVPQCLRCHGNQALATLNNNTTSAIAPGTGNIDTNRVAGNTTPRGGSHQEHLKGSLGMSRKVRCVECHVTPALTAVNHAKLDNRTTATLTFTGTANGVGWTESPLPSVTRTSGIITCNNTACHTGKTNTGAAPPTWNATGYLAGTAPNATININDCKQCHALPPTPGSGAHITIAAPVSGFPLNSQCAANCHSLSTTATTYQAIFSDPSLHINGKIEGGNDCLSCHTGPQGVRPAIAGEFALQSHHVQGRAITNADCYMCHLESSNAAGVPDATYHKNLPGYSVDLIVMTGAMGTGVRGTYTYVAYTANGKRSQIRKINDHCLGCHNPTNSGIAPFVAGSFPGKYSPEPNLPVPKTASSIMARYTSTRKVTWSNFNYSSAGRFGTNGKKNITKALSAHGNAIGNEFPNWDPAVNGKGEDAFIGAYGGDIAPTTLGKDRNVLCYDCHNSHGSNATGITSSYNSATGTNAGGILKTTVNNQRGYKATYTPAARTITYRNYSSKGQTTATTTAALFNTGASLCNDCHNNDTAKVNINKPWSITGTYSSTKAIVGYWSTPYFDNYTFASAERTVYKMGGAVSAANDRRKPMGGHFGSSIPSRQAGHTAEVNGLCTPCHDPHGVSKTALSTSDQAYAVPLLKGTWVTSPYKEDKATTNVWRGGGSWAGFASSAAVPGYHIDQNTLVAQPAPRNGGASVTTAKTNQRGETFASFATSAATLQTTAEAQFAGLCIGCHSKSSLTNSTNTTAATWKTTGRIHQAVKGWAATTGGNMNNTTHAYTCSKCHAPHISRLPRLMITNCLDINHFKQAVTGGSVNPTKGATTAFAGNLYQSTAKSGKGAGRFPGGGSNYYAGTSGQNRNMGPWWFVTTKPTTYTADSAANYGTSCHNSANAGGATYSPVNQQWNKKTPW